MALLTGASGMLGAHLAYQLIIGGQEVVALKRESTNLSVARNIFLYYNSNGAELFEKIKWVVGDILDFYTIDDLVKNQKEVYHTAAYVSFNKADNKAVMDINVQGTINIVESCLKHNSRLVYASSVAALGRSDNGGKITENDFRTEENRGTVYSRSKFIAEREVWRGIAEGLNAVMVNPSVIIGPGDLSKSSSQLFKTVRNGLKVYTNGSNGYVDVRDVAKAMIELMQSDIKAERFILSSEDVTYKDLFAKIAKQLNVAPPKFLVSKFMSEIAWRIIGLISFVTGIKPLITKDTSQIANSHYSYSSKNIQKALDFKFITIEDSIENASNFFNK